MREPFEELPGHELCFGSDPTKYDPFMRLPIEHDGTLRSRHYYGNYGEILLTIDNDGHRRCCDRFVDRLDQVLRQSARGIFYPDTTSPKGKLPATRSPHSETIDDGDIRCDPVPLEIMRHHIPYGINGLTRQKGEYLFNIPVQVAKRFLEELPVLFGQGKHQRTFSA